MPGLALVLLAIGFYWKITLTRQYVWFDHPDMCYIEVPRLQMQTKEIHARRFPLWDPYLWAGQPLIGQTQPGPLFPLNLIFTLLPRKGGFIQFPLLNLYYVVIHLIAAWGAYRLLREWGRSASASIFGGYLFAFAGFLGTVAWLDVINGAIWLPWIFIPVFRAMRGYRPWAHAAWSGFWMGVAWLCGHHEIPLMTTILLGATWLWHAFKDRRAWLLGGASLGIMALIGAAQLLPTYEFGRLSKRWIGLTDPVGWADPVPYTISEFYSMPFRALLSLFLPGEGTIADSSLFVGVVSLGLAAIGLRTGWHDVRLRWAAAVGGTGILFALGAGTPLHGILYSVIPLLTKARVPVRAICFVNFAIAILAAYGMDGLRERAARVWALVVERVALAFGILILAAAVVFALALRLNWSDAIFRSAILATAFAGLLAAWRLSRIDGRVLAAGLLALAIIEWYGASSHVFSNLHDPKRPHFTPVLTQNRDIANFLHYQTQAARKAGHAGVRVAVSEADIPTNFGDWHGIEVLQGYVAGVSSNLIRAELHTRRTHQLFGVTHWIGREKLREEQEQVFQGESGIKVYRSPGVMPRAWVAHEAVRVHSDGELQRAIQNPQVDFARQVLTLSDLPPLENCAGDEVRFTGWTTDRVELSAQVRCRGVLVLADPYYPGWRATIDGKPAEVHEVYGSIRGVVVEPGEHQVVFRFQPLSVYLGWFSTVLGLIALGVIVRRNRR